jgi:hypothetical protein
MMGVMRGVALGLALVALPLSSEPLSRLHPRL